MGLKPGEQVATEANGVQAMQKQAFDVLDKEYEYARVTTHLNRGKGLGFASYSSKLIDPNQPHQL
jgi:hypothetical protein